MIKNDPVIQNMLYGNILQKIAEEHDTSPEESKKIFGNMSFLEYVQYQTPELVSEQNITPPSGQAIGPAAAPASAPSTTEPAEKQPKPAPKTWSGTGPLQQGMMVSVKNMPDQAGKPPMPMSVTKFDQATGQVEVEDPTRPGQKTSYNIKDIGTYTAATTESIELARLKTLAGIAESCSAGATGAGNIAVAIGETGSMIRRRTTTEERWAREYTPRESAKTVVGDTKPAQASGELSANLAANGKKTARRTRNGFKK
jgi:hypothetical protein